MRSIVKGSGEHGYCLNVTDIQWDLTKEVKDFGGSLYYLMVESHNQSGQSVYDFPTEVSPLSKQRPDDPDTVERFEFYIHKMEVANAFSELNDPAEQRRRFEAQLTGRASGDLTVRGTSATAPDDAQPEEGAPEEASTIDAERTQPMDTSSRDTRQADRSSSISIGL